ncbi:serine/threonine-protein kinase HipA [Desulfomicrobium apsheronum]|uniref:Serine/threonine-protein kinase HipA n=1 Tax=Desulfomicrobium apsheronum TaxID=52560 RepID=A0A1I3Q252_9BACT|nr:serine/threonine-protein kinase HipA [Desulfomicrobium apsheronum]
MTILPCIFSLCFDDSAEATGIVYRVITAIRDNWDRVCDEARLTPVDKNLMWQRQFLNPYSIGRY